MYRSKLRLCQQNGLRVLAAWHSKRRKPLIRQSATLTPGAATQDPRLQALESGAVAGNYGDDAQRMANRRREIQSEQAKLQFLH